MTTVCTTDTPDDHPCDRGDRIAAHVQRSEQELAAWLDDLARFDHDQDWALDGQPSAAAWLMWRCRMARATAFDRLRVAHQLRQRPHLGQALASGRASYSAIRTITRATHATPDVDDALIDLARHGTITDVEAAVRTYLAHRGQHRPPANLDTDTFLRIYQPTAGMADGRLRGPETDMDEAAAILAEFEHDLWQAEHPDRTTPEGTPTPSPTRRFQALMAALRMASAYRRSGGSLDPGAVSDRFIVNYVHIVNPDQQADTEVDSAPEVDPTPEPEPGTDPTPGAHRPPANPVLLRPDGQPLDPGLAGCVSCDCTSVHHQVTPDGEPLGIGRASREWTRAQRRAAALRDNSTCRYPGCHRRIIDLHHQRWWSKGGPTDLDNAISLCRHHHRLQHQGFRIHGNPNHELTFTRPDGTPIGTTRAHRPRNPIPAQSPRETATDDPNWGWWAA